MKLGSNAKQVIFDKATELGMKAALTIALSTLRSGLRTIGLEIFGSCDSYSILDTSLCPLHFDFHTCGESSHAICGM